METWREKKKCKVLFNSRAEDSEGMGFAYDFNTIRNINPWGADFEPTVRGGMRSWNMTVQHWLAVNVYKKIQAHKPIRYKIQPKNECW